MSRVVPFPKKASVAPRLEVHEHCFIRGDRSRYAGLDRGRVVHSHPGGDVPHQHPDTGPASYTIDKDDWFRATGMRGGGRKNFTVQSTGEQFPIVKLTDEQKSFEVVVAAPPPDFGGQGSGIAPIARMVLACGMTPIFRDGNDEGAA